MSEALQPEAQDATPFTARDAAEVRRQLAGLDPHEQPTEVLPAVRGDQAAAPATETLDLASGELVDAGRDDPSTPEQVTEAQVVDSEVKKPGEHLKFVSAKLSDHDIRLIAIEAAESQLQQEHAEAKGVKGFLRNVWRATIDRERVKNKYIAEATSTLLETQNMLATKGGDIAAHAAEMQATIDNLLAAYDSDGQSALRRGESIERAEATEGQKAFEDGVKDLVSRFVEGELTADSLEEARTRLLDDLSSQYPELSTADIMRGDNLVEVAKQAKALVEHGAALDDLMQQMEFYAAEARAGVNTEVHMNACDRIIEKIQSGRAGRWLNDSTIATAVSVGYSAVRLMSGRAVGMVGAVIAPGVGAAALGGLRENFRYKGERQQDMRERAQGLEAAPGQKRRERMGQTAYEMISARETVDSIGDLLKDGLSMESADSLLGVISGVQLRQELGDSQRIDLIGFSSPERVAQERLELTLATAKARAALRGWLEAATPAERAALGGSPGVDLGALMQNRSEALRVAIDQDIAAKDKLFARHKRAAIAGAVVKSALVGLGIGIVGQEVAAAVNPGQQGVLESLWHSGLAKGEHQTLLRSLFSGHERSGGTGQTAMHFERVHSGYLFKLPEGVKLVHAPDKSLSLVDHGKTLISGLEIGKNGPDQHTLESLRGIGVTGELHKLISTHTEHQTVSRGLHEFLQRHQEGTASVRRLGWFDNDTPAVFDKNELKLWWGGHNGLDSHGNYVFNVSHMTPGGSYHAGLSENAQELAHQGKLNVYLSASEGTQHRPFEFHIDTDGNVHIPKDSVAGRSLFGHEHGQAMFKGRFAEVGHVESHTGNTENIRVFATYEGQGISQVQETIARHVSVEHFVTALGRPGVGAPAVDAPPIIPIYPRREMEPLKPEEAASPEITYGYGYGEREPWRRVPISPRLERNPEASLNMQQELAWYFSEMQKSKPEELAELDRQIDADQVLSDLPSGLEIVVAMPVAAASEAENLYHTFELYAAQGVDALGKTIFVINLNWKTSDDEKAIRATRKELDRIKSDFPALKIAIVTDEMPPEGRKYGAIIKHCYDTAMRAVDRAISEKGAAEAPSDVVLITNDADAQGMTRGYLSRYQSALQNDTEADMFYGFIRWGTERFPEYPGFAFVATLMQALELEARHEDEGYQHNPASWGPNSAFRMSALAAIGGADANYGAGADSDIGNRIWQLRTQSRAAGGGEGYYGGVGSGVKSPGGRRVGHVVPSVIDSASDRILGAYSAGVPVVEAWTHFDKEARDAKGAGTPEDIEKDFDLIRDRIEFQVTAILGRKEGTYGWFKDERLVKAALDKLLPAEPSGKPRYEFDADGKFKLTESGAAWLKKQLLYKPKEMADSYEGRKKETLGDIGPKSRRRKRKA